MFTTLTSPATYNKLTKILKTNLEQHIATCKVPQRSMYNHVLAVFKVGLYIIF